MKKNESNVSIMQTVVWQMKEKTYKETKDLDAGKFFAYINGKYIKKKKSNHRNRTAQVQPLP
ncbi:MAG: hypothetical protein PHW04_16860 [Candidatus Wallbacteria bacterium]|nr:hypothetical protein [Candidatus Wallbacteria bacterium]